MDVVTVDSCPGKVSPACLDHIPVQVLGSALAGMRSVGRLGLTNYKISVVIRTRGWTTTITVLARGNNYILSSDYYVF